MDANFSIHAMHFLKGYLSFSFQISMMHFPKVNKMVWGGGVYGFMVFNTTFNNISVISCFGLGNVRYITQG
jgi:hypothetical protein